MIYNVIKLFYIQTTQMCWLVNRILRFILFTTKKLLRVTIYTENALHVGIICVSNFDYYVMLMYFHLKNGI